MGRELRWDRYSFVCRGGKINCKVQDFRRGFAMFHFSHHIFFPDKLKSII